MSYQPLRLVPGADILTTLRAHLHHSGAEAAFVIAGIGSLHDAHLRFAQAGEATLIPGPCEILTLSGTLSSDGAHLHMSVSDAHGKVHGGHVSTGNTVRTTAEILLCVLEQYRFTRQADPGTGYRELQIEVLAAPDALDTER